jgi:hypothetical protein
MLAHKNIECKIDQVSRIEIYVLGEIMRMLCLKSKFFRRIQKND